ncbi:hypothetical protein AMELA_G00019200 [Ameiurus melas]|uniref:Uncharacterized protein n=1 Tax=Ameiurus melas TaxID=219545 RepID=A0A7J6BBD5_AMEME|nr:hypothetical protein AMELA_G00019200 [Ameiurus melas]
MREAVRTRSTDLVARSHSYVEVEPKNSYVLSDWPGIKKEAGFKRRRSDSRLAARRCIKEKTSCARSCCRGCVVNVNGVLKLNFPKLHWMFNKHKCAKFLKQMTACRYKTAGEESTFVLTEENFRGTYGSD